MDGPELDDSWVEDDDPNDPNHPDYDLSHSGMHVYRESTKPWYLRRAVLLVIGILVIVGLLLPFASLL
jgi:hypothetical protein